MSSLILEARTLARYLSAIYTKLWFRTQSTPSSTPKSLEKATTFHSYCQLLMAQGFRLWFFLKTTLLPHVSPIHVRKLQESFAESFSKQEQDSNTGMEELRSWRSALTRAANLSGWDSRDYKKRSERESQKREISRDWKGIRLKWGGSRTGNWKGMQLRIFKELGLCDNVDLFFGSKG
ncbi:unnamed protein product [Malus baccata var. baccata]